MIVTMFFIAVSVSVPAAETEAETEKEAQFMPPATAPQASGAAAYDAATSDATLQSLGANLSPPVVDSSQPTSAAAAVDSLDREGLQATFELFNRMSDDLAGSYRALEQRVAALTDELNRVNQQRDIEVKSREQVSSRLNNLLDLLPGGVIVLDRWGQVSECNPAAEELLGENLLGRRWVDLIAEFFAPREDDWHEISLKNGRRVSLSTRSLEAETGQIILLTDQTETRRLQQQVSRNERLSALGHMVSALAHQIRTPLSAAILYAGHLSERDLTAEQTRKFSNKIASRLNHLEQQVRDMLIFAKGDVPLQDSISVEQLLDDLRVAVEVPLAASAVHLDLINCCGENYLRCNRQALVGAVTNLLNNAIQASEQGSSIKLQALVQDGALCLAVEDTGSGMPAEVLQRLNAEEAFVTTKSQGTGLGLAVVRAVAKAHSGSLSINSEPGRGTHAMIRLPVVAGIPEETIDNSVANACAECTTGESS